MRLDAEWIIAACAAVGLMITWTTTILGGAIWLMRRLDGIKHEILADFQTKHDENTEEVKALRALVMRHDIMLDPEFNGSASPKARSRQ